MNAPKTQFSLRPMTRLEAVALRDRCLRHFIDRIQDEPVVVHGPVENSFVVCELKFAEASGFSIVRD